MIILSIDSSTPVAGIAVSDGYKLLGEVMINTKNTHSEKLMPMVEQLLNDLDLRIQQVEAVAVTCGPGSFTGLRIGMATAKGIAHCGSNTGHTGAEFKPLSGNYLPDYECAKTAGIYSAL